MTELQAERTYIDAVYERLQELRRKATQLAGEANWRDEDYVVDSLFERDVVASRAAERLRALDVPKGRIAVGRLDREDGDRWYIGRLAVADEAGDPMIIDWRAPAAEAFYRAVPADPLGVVRRRHFRWRWDELVGLDDEVLDAEAAMRDGLDLVGEGALLAALTAPRTGRMTDVVATIQAEQDRVIRRPKPGVLVVQGAPGTGKTAVALHRAAYLLYAEQHSFRNDNAILFVGPNETFLRYVEEVVPSLGEDRVVLATPSELGPDVPLGRVDPPEVVRLKGDARMADVLATAIRQRARVPAGEVDIPCGRFVLHLERDALKRVVSKARAADGAHNDRRRLAERGVLRVLQQAYDAAQERDVRHRRIGVTSDQRVLDLVDQRQIAQLVDRMWPLLTPEKLLRWLYRNPQRLVRAGLTEDEAALLQRDDEDETWSEADVALLDELRVLLGELPARRARRSTSPTADPIVERVLADLTPDCPVCSSELTFVSRGGEPQDDRLRCDVCEPVRFFRAYEVMGDMAAQQLRSVHDSIVLRNVTSLGAPARRPGDVTYGHVVVDEAQDLSAMQWRALARRCPSLSMTVAGDQGQAIRPGGTGTWASAVEALGADTFDLAELTVNYRTPTEVMTAAEAVLAEAGVPYSTTRSVRSTQDPIVHVVENITPDVVRAVVDSIDIEGTRAVIAPLERCDDLDAMDVTQAKGLEFDAVVVVDPDGIAAEGEGGARRVYVAMTRTTNVLHLIR